MNQIIHIIFVPLIVWSAMVLLVLGTPGEHHALVELDSKSLAASILPEFGINFSLFAFLFYAIYYLTLDFVPAVSFGRATATAHSHSSLSTDSSCQGSNVTVCATDRECC